MKTLKMNLNYIVIVTAIVFVWRGIWGLSDLFIFPENELLSLSTSILIGITLLLLTDFKKKDISELL